MLRQRHLSYVNCFGRRMIATQVKVKENEQASSSPIDTKSWKPFKEMPGPNAVEYLMGYLPGGKFYKKSFSDTMLEMAKKYGTTYLFPGLFGNDPFVVALDPNDFPTVLRNEGKWPDRRIFHSITYYRQVYRKDFFQDANGVLFSAGEEWAQNRSTVNPILMQPKNAKLYLNTMLEVNEEFLLRIREIRDPKTLEVPDNFEDEINRFTFESVAAVALNTQLGLIRKNRDAPESQMIIRNLRKVFDLATELDIMPSIWKYVKTPKFYELMKTLDIMTNICIKYIDEALARIEQDSDGKLTSKAGKEKSVVEKLIKVNRKLAIVMALDMMFAGVDTTSTTLVSILLCVAKNPDKQRKLFEEVKQILPEKDSELTIENMKNMPYLRACMKESMRMYPLIPGIMRRMPHEVVIGGYRVPEGMEISVSSNVQLRNEQYVPRPNEFLPERWIRRGAGGREQLIDAIETPFMFLPFGFGPRMCLGKRILELELEIALARLIRNFEINFHYPTENAFKAKFINVPAIPLKFQFVDRP